jgi:outer membrane protein assembly complex protein YaeT
MPRAGFAMLAVLAATVASGPAAAQEPHPVERTVVGLRFEGNRAIPGDTLAAAIATSASSWNYTWFLRGLTGWLPFGDRRAFDETEFRRDAVRLLLFYRQHGYYEARVDTVVRRAEREVHVTFQIVEGPPVLVEGVEVTGTAEAIPPGDLVRALPLRTGRPFNRFLFDASSDTLTRALRNRGYPFAAVYRSYSVNRPTRVAHVEYAVDLGPRARIGEIRIEGADRVAEPTIRRQLALREGEPYRLDALFESQRALYQTDLFRAASVGIAADSVVGGQDSLVRLRVRVAEASATQLRVGAGYGTIDCFRVSAQSRVRGFLGSARLLDVTGRVSKIGVGYPTSSQLGESLCPALAEDEFSDTLNYLLDVTLTQPSLLVRRSQLALSATLERRSEVNAYLFESYGARVALNLGFGRAVPVTLAYRIAREETQASPATYCIYFNTCDPATIGPLLAPMRNAGVTVSAAWRNVDNALDPTEGHVISAEGTLAAKFLGSQVVFSRILGEATNYQRLGRRSTVALRVRAGIVHAGVGSFGATDLRYVPPSDRFYLGGPSNVRGFARNEMGPQVYVADDDSLVGTGPLPTDSAFVPTGAVRASPAGSGAMVMGNAELRVPTGVWAGRVVLAAYLDAAKLWQEIGSADDTTKVTYVPGELQLTPGLGVQINTPLGPMRLDGAYNSYGLQEGPWYVSDPSGALILRGTTSRPPGGTFLSRIQWHFSVGLAF